MQNQWGHKKMEEWLDFWPRCKMAGMGNDLRYALRQIRRRAGSSAIVIVTFALGIGLNTALFSVVDALLLRALPGFETDRLVTIREQHGAQELDSISGGTIRAWRRQAQSFESIEAEVREPFNLTGVESAEVVEAADVTSGYFRLQRTQAVLGRTFLPGEDAPGRNRLVVLDHAFWKRKFGGDPDILGRSVRLDREAYRVVGVLAPDFHPFGSNAVQLYIPLAMEERPAWGFRTMARLRPGVGLEAARAEMLAMARALGQVDRSRKGFDATVVRVRETSARNVRSALLALFAAASLVLLIACANIANVLAAHASARMPEFATRLALGAQRRRLARQVVTETLVLAALGGLAGLLFASCAVPALAAWNPGGLARMNEVRLDLRAIGFALAAALVAGTLAALGPVAAVMSRDLSGTMRRDSQGAGGAIGQRRKRGVLVVAEVAITVVLVTAAALVLQYFLHLQRAGRGYDPRQLLTLMLSSPVPPGADGTAPLALYRRIAEDLQKLPGVHGIGMATRLPIGGIGIGLTVRPEGQPAPPRETPQATTSVINPDYFRVMGIPVLAGRAFTNTDKAGARPVVVISEAVARRFFPGQNPLGQKLLIETWDPNLTRMGSRVAREIVGVVGNVQQEELKEKDLWQMYLPMEQNPVCFVMVAVRTEGAPATLQGAIERQILRADGETPPSDVKTMEARVRETLAVPRQAAQLFGGFAGLALLLAVVGIYGVLSYSVASRTQEIGLRMALGAGPGDILRLVLGESLRHAGLGLGLGLAGAVAVQHWMMSALFDIRAADPLILAAVAVAITSLMVVAAWQPARVATRVDPYRALRS